MTKHELVNIIKEEIAKELANNKSQLTNESFDLDAVKYSSSIKTQVDKLVDAISKTPNLNKNAVASILNDIIMALGLDKTQMTMYMNMIRQERGKYKF
jgi:DNA relaxase NicK